MGAQSAYSQQDTIFTSEVIFIIGEKAFPCEMTTSPTAQSIWFNLKWVEIDPIEDSLIVMQYFEPAIVITNLESSIDTIWNVFDSFTSYADSLVYPNVTSEIDDHEAEMWHSIEQLCLYSYLVESMLPKEVSYDLLYSNFRGGSDIPGLSAFSVMNREFYRARAKVSSSGAATFHYESRSVPERQIEKFIKRRGKMSGDPVSIWAPRIKKFRRVTILNFGLSEFIQSHDHLLFGPYPGDFGVHQKKWRKLIRLNPYVGGIRWEK